jgi:hypothetical protein
VTRLALYTILRKQERGDALSSLFYSTLGLADTLVRSSDSLAQLYGTALYILMFKEFKDPFLKSVSTGCMILYNLHIHVFRCKVTVVCECYYATVAAAVV